MLEPVTAARGLGALISQAGHLLVRPQAKLLKEDGGARLLLA